MKVDVLVVGGGIAGLTAACRAAQLGLRAAVLEQGTDERYACNSRYSGGIIHVAFRNVKSPQSELVAAIDDATQRRAEPALVQALASTCGRAVDWLRESGARFIRVGNIEWQQWVLAPPRPLTPGLDWKGRGPDVTMRTLAALLEQRGGALMRGARAVSLLETDRACVGLEAETPDGRRVFEASAVILADGGFQGDEGLLQEHITPAPDRLKQRGASTGVGDGLRMALAIGARHTDLRYFYGHLLCRDAFGNDRVWPYPQLDELGTSGIVVDSAGSRFVDEGMGGVFVANTIAKLRDPLSAWAVFDDAIWEGAGRTARIPANPLLASAGGTIYKANTLGELTAAAGIGARLESTVAAYNEALASGSASALTPCRTATVVAPAPLVHKPYYAVPLCAGITYTFGGIATNERGQVLRSDGSVVAGLYAVGATTGGLEGGTGGGYVGGLVKGVAFALRAAECVKELGRSRG